MPPTELMIIQQVLRVLRGALPLTLGVRHLWLELHLMLFHWRQHIVVCLILKESFIVICLLPITTFIFIIQNSARRDVNQIHYEIKITFETPSFETTYTNRQEGYSVIYKHFFNSSQYNWAFWAVDHRPGDLKCSFVLL